MVAMSRMRLLLLLLPFVTVARGSECQKQASRAYIKALVSHTQVDADAVPLEEDVARYEGPPGISIETAKGAIKMRKSLVGGPSSYTVDNATDFTYSFPGDHRSVQVNYTIDVGLFGGRLHLIKTKIEEVFSFNSTTACKIQRIDAVVHIGKTNEQD